MFQKKAALNLSVEAIIIFVLAFAMLGVGLFITDLLREGAGSGIQKALATLDDLEEKPTSQKPITGITKEGINVQTNKNTKEFIGFYNKDRQPATEATVVIDYCKSGSTGDVYEGTPVSVITIPSDVAPSTAQAFSLSLKTEDLPSGDLYFCKLKIVKESDPSIIYAQQQIVVNVVS